MWDWPVVVHSQFLDTPGHLLLRAPAFPVISRALSFEFTRDQLTTDN